MTRHQQGSATSVDIALKGGLTITITQDPTSGDLGTSLWDASVILVHYMDDNKQYSQKLHSKRVLELGAGCGLAGIYCSLKGADVTLTDLEQVLPILRTNVRANLGGQDAQPSNKHQVEAFCWGDAICSTTLCPPYDYILACDCVYVESLVEPLVWSLEQLATQSTTVIICSEKRELTTHAVFTERLERSFTIRRVAQKHLHPSYAHENAEILMCKLKKGLSANNANAVTTALPAVATDSST
eukprot:6109-Heterococcus_DN1.PRE.1